jgi:hypothetical protein
MHRISNLQEKQEDSVVSRERYDMMCYDTKFIYCNFISTRWQ